MSENINSRKILNLYLIVVSLVGMMIVYVATSRYGPGVSGDSVRYLSVAQNLMDGIGFFDYSLAPLLAWPPLYSVALALLAAITGDVFVAGWVMNICLFGLTIYLTGQVIASIAPRRSICAYLSALVVLMLPSLVRAYCIIAADPLFVVLSLLFFRQGALYLRSGMFSRLVLLGVLASLACLVKYPGLVLSLSGSILILAYYSRRQRRKTGLLAGVAFLMASTLPLLGWVMFHNYFLYGSAFGERGYAEPLGNLYIAVEKVLYWFIPYSLIQRVTPYGLFLLILTSAFVVFQPASWRRWFDRLGEAEMLPILPFAVLYSLTLMFLVSYSEHKHFGVDRLHIILVFPLLAFIAAAAETLRLRWDIPRESSLPLIATVVCFFGWSVYPVYNTYKYIEQSIREGETDNNLYNTRVLRESDIVKYLESNQYSPDETLYSNHEGAAWFYTRHNVLGMPQGDRANEENQDAAKVLKEYRSWPPQDGYIIWFNLDFKLHVLVPETLTPLAVMTPLFRGKGGDVYRVLPRRQ